MSEIQLITDGAAMAELLHSDDGPVALYVIGRATLVQTASKASLAPGHGLITGKMRDGIVKRNETINGEFAVRISATTKYSIFVHEGTAPHEIISKKPHNLLVFNGRNGIAFVNTSKKPVMHPGNAPNRFLSDFLHLATE